MKAWLLAAVLAALASTHAFAQTPTPGSRDQRVTSVPYQVNNVVRVNATYGISTMIIFDEAETFETISLGDTESWQVVPSERGNILFVKPIARDVRTNMNIVTSQRIYYLELFDHAPAAGNQTFGIRFIYPENNLNNALREEAEYRAAYPNISSLDKDNVNINYSFSGSNGLKPSMVFDDGVKTYFKFTGRVPAIFRVNSDFSETLVNFRKEGDFIVVDGAGAQWTLRDGDEWTCIFNLRVPDFGAPDPDYLGPSPATDASLRRGSGN